MLTQSMTNLGAGAFHDAQQLRIVLAFHNVMMVRGNLKLQIHIDLILAQNEKIERNRQID